MVSISGSNGILYSVVSIAGGRHIMSGQQFGSNTALIDMNEMKKVIDFDRERGIVGAGENAHTCSRQESDELFRLAIGRYGLFGIIATVVLRLAPLKKFSRMLLHPAQREQQHIPTCLPLARLTPNSIIWLTFVSYNSKFPIGYQSLSLL